MAPYFKFKLRVWPAECTFSHSVYCLPAVAGRDRQQWQAGHWQWQAGTWRRPGRRGPGGRRRRRPMRQPRSGQTGQRLRICLISIRSPQPAVGRRWGRAGAGQQSRAGLTTLLNFYFGKVEETIRLFLQPVTSFLPFFDPG